MTTVRCSVIARSFRPNPPATWEGVNEKGPQSITRIVASRQHGVSGRRRARNYQ